MRSNVRGFYGSSKTFNHLFDFLANEFNCLLVSTVKAFNFAGRGNFALFLSSDTSVTPDKVRLIDYLATK
jgi:hypothetical protein